MKSNPISLIGTFLIALLSFSAKAQFSASASAVWINNCSANNFFNTSGSIGPSPFSDLGVYTQNAGTLILKGGQVNTSHNISNSNVCAAHLYYNVHLQSNPVGSFTSVNLTLLESCNGSNKFPSDNSACVAGDQRWQSLLSNIDLTANAPGNYVLEVYYDVTGKQAATSGCTDVLIIDNGGSTFKANFSIQSPNLSSTNPSSCFGNQGSITIGGLVAGTTYQVGYTKDGTDFGPSPFTANGSGQVIINALAKGFYSNFSLGANGCTTNLFTGIILSDPIFVPTFNPIPAFCAGTPAPTLPTTSKNGMTGTWNPPAVDNQNSATYVFTPDANQCGVNASLPVTVTPPTVPTFSFGTSLVICAGASVPALPTTSVNGITGTWNFPVVDNQTSRLYTFSPTPGPCATSTSFFVQVTPNINPTFSFGTSLTICAGASVPVLPTTSVEGVTGSWAPSTVDNQNSNNYVFTPDAGQCATTTSFAVTVNPNVTPTFGFGTSMSACAGANVPVLPTTSANGITGTWSPTAVDNENSNTYVFTPDPGQCAIPASFDVTINPNLTPTFSFGTVLAICAGAAVPSLPTTSDNGFTGIWTPPVVDNMITRSYLFTPDAGQCANPVSFGVNVSPIATPAFSFGTILTICAGGSVPTLPGTSLNGVIGTWNPAVVDKQNSKTYTFTPFAGQCATSATYTVTVSPNITPTFSFGTGLTACAGSTMPVLPTTSTNGITGTWNPTTANNQSSGTYTFTPTAGQCASSASFAVTISPNIVPSFGIGTSLSLCAGASVPVLPTTSLNSISGTWSPSTIDNQNSATYTFTPTAGQCATTATFVVTVNPNLTPTFSFGTSLTVCAGSPVPVLPTTSSNGITGTWSPTTVDNANSATYIFTPDAGQCVTGPVNFAVTITPNLVPTFSFGTALTICAGATIPVLPTTSINGFTGTWTPSVVNNQSSGTYVFTSNSAPCITPLTFTVTVNPIVKPAFGFGQFQSICIGTTVPVLAGTSDNSITGTWNPPTVDNTINAKYVFTPSPGQCTDTTSFSLEVNAVPSSSISTDTTVYDGDFIPSYNFTNSAGSTVNWTNSNPSIGLQGSGSGAVPGFSAVNRTNQPVTATITATPIIGGCSGTAQSYVINVLPLNKDVFVPNVFTPNGDGKNDILYAYGNYIDKIDMRIFNQWGQMIATITNKTQGWDGKYRGSPQPVGVYVYVLRAELTDGRTVNLKGSITLLR